MKALTLVATAATIMLTNTAWAQQGVSTDPNVRPVIRSLVDHTRTQRLVGPGRLEAGGASGAAGATLLPFDMPVGNYFNAADYPLQIALIPTATCYESSLAVDGRLIANGRDDCENSLTSVGGVVPARSSFTVSGGLFVSRVTALANGANWRQTGIRFAVAGGPWEARFIPPQVNVVQVNICAVTIELGEGQREIINYAVVGDCRNGTAVGIFDSGGNYAYAAPSSLPGRGGFVGTRTVNIANPVGQCSGGQRALDNFGEISSNYVIAYSYGTTSVFACSAPGLQGAYEASIVPPPPPSGGPG